MLFGIARDQCASFPRQFRLERTRSLMEPRMDHTAVQPRRFLARSVVLLDACGREALHRKLSRNGAADNASGAYDADVKHRSGKSLKMASTPRVRNNEACSGSLIVQTLTCRLASRAASINDVETMSFRG